MALRGYLVGTMNILPNDPRLLDCSREELLFAAHWKKKILAEQWEIAATMIGTRWRPEVVHAAESSGGGAAREAYDFPLALLLNPNLYKLLKKMVPKPDMPGDDKDLKTALGFDPIRENQRRLFNEGKRLLEGLPRPSSPDTGAAGDSASNNNTPN